MPPPSAVALLLAVLALPALPGRLAADLRPRRQARQVAYHTTHPSAPSGPSSTSSAYFSTGYPTGYAAGYPAAYPATYPAAYPAAYPPTAPPTAPPAPTTTQDPLALLNSPNSPYGDVPPPPPPPPGPPPPYTVNAERGLTYATAPQAPPLRPSYAPSSRISYGRVGVLARVGYTAPPIANAAPALLFTDAKDGGLATPPQPPSYEAPPPPAYAPAPYAPPQYSPEPYAPPPYDPLRALRLYPVPGPAYPRGGRVLFRPSQPAPAPPPFGVPYNLALPLVAPATPATPAGPAAPPQSLDPEQPARDPDDPTPARFVQNFDAPPVSPILLSRNRAGDTFYLGGLSNYLR